MYDIFIHNKVKKKLLYLVSLSHDSRELWGFIVSDRGLSSEKSAFFIENTPKRTPSYQRLESGRTIRCGKKASGNGSTTFSVAILR